MNGGNVRAVDVRIQLLGPVRLIVDDEPVAIKGAGIRGLLAILALHPNQVVTLEYLLDTLWQHDPPATARTIVHGNVSQLRRTLTSAQHNCADDASTGGYPAVRLETAPLGYRLRLDPDVVDAHHARSLLEQARTEPLARRTELLERAFALWQGSSLGGVPQSMANTELHELWRAVHGARVDAELELGRHAELVAELNHLVEVDPAAERTVGQLMRALYYSGRRGAALEVYQRAANHILRTLGIEPGPELMELHERLLRDDMPSGPRSAADAEQADTGFPPGVPAQLPAATPGLAGRDADIGWLDAMRAAADRGISTVGVLSGTAGIGKTALLVSWAHRVAECFPDGVLFASLHACQGAQEPLDSADVLAQFLRGLGVPAAELPEAANERVALYRTLLARRAVLVLLDDAHSARQVQPLLPPGGASLTVITSRVRLDDLTVSHGARHRVLDTLAPAEAAKLVAAVAGPDSAGRNDRIARLCGNLPLALRLASARLAASPQWTSSDLVRELEDEHTRLAALDVAGADTSVRAALDVSYRGLSADLAETFLRIGVLSVDFVDSYHVAALCDVDLPTARHRLRTLAAHSLLSECARDVFTGHDLVRLFARETAEAELDAARRARVLDSSLRFYLAACDLARRKLLRIVDPLDFTGSIPAHRMPEFVDSDEAAAWYEREWENVLGTLEDGLAAGRDEQVWQLARIAHTYRVVQPWWQQWDRLLEIGMPAAERAAGALGRYWMHISRCAAALTFDFAEQSLTEGEQALSIATQLGEDRLRLSASIHVGCALNSCGRHEESIKKLRMVLAEPGLMDDPALRGQALNNCAEAEKQAGLLPEAIEHQLAALEIDRSLGDDSYAVVSLNNLAEMYLASDDLGTAQGYARESVKLTSAHGFILQEGVSRLTLGRILRADRVLEEAHDQLSSAVTLHERVGSKDADAIRAELDALPEAAGLANT